MTISRRRRAPARRSAPSRRPRLVGRGRRAGAGGSKVLRYAFVVAETSFDPAQINDLYSRTVTPHIFEALYRYDHLARPIKIVPLTRRRRCPRSADDFRTWTIRIRPGIFFADDPAFKGKPRELVGAGLRLLAGSASPTRPTRARPGPSLRGRGRTSAWTRCASEALKTKQPFDYDREIEGLRALDRYTLQFKLEEPRPRFLEHARRQRPATARSRARSSSSTATRSTAHPVGTGPFRLAAVAAQLAASCSSATRATASATTTPSPPPTTPRARRCSRASRAGACRWSTASRSRSSRRTQPRWLSFLNGEPTSSSACRLAVHRRRRCRAASSRRTSPSAASAATAIVEPRRARSTFFNMDDPVVGGYSAGQGRAAARDRPRHSTSQREIALAAPRPGDPRAVADRCRTRPATTRRYNSEISDYDPARAKALLDLYGYVDRDGDGWREQPGRQRRCVLSTSTPSADQRQPPDRRAVRQEHGGARHPHRARASRSGRRT